MILTRLRDAPGRIEKELVLRICATERDKKMFRYAYDKNMVYGLKFTDDWFDTEDLKDPCDSDFVLLNKLRNRELTGDTARTAVRNHCNEYGPLVMLICNKDLDCGVTATTVNKVFPGVVPVFKVQLAKEMPLDKVKLPCWAETKYDGVRIFIINRDGNVEFRTRNGKAVNLPKLQAHIEAIYPINYVLDCEVTFMSGKMEDRTKVSGLINSAMKGGTINESLLMFNVFDYVGLHDFFNQSCMYDRDQRRVFIRAKLADIRSPQLRISEEWWCESIEDIQTVYSTHIANGLEGLILKRADSLYTFKRTTEWTKMKETKTADLQCTGVVPGMGKYNGCIGALICEGVVEGQIVHVKAGAGLTDHQRHLPLHCYIGKTIELKYNALISDKVTRQHSLFLPRFVTVREDK